MLNKLERKFGNLAIPNLMSYLISGYIIGYIFALMTPGILGLMTLEPYMIIHKLQLWRIITWVLIPPSSFGIFTIIMLIFYWQLGRSLEQIWGTFRFNVYIFGGIFFTIIGAFVYYGIVYATKGIEVSNMGLYFSTYYINLSIFLAYALAIPNMRIFLYFFIPIKMKYLAILYAVIVGYSFFTAPVVTERVSILCSLLNFIIFFFSTRNYKSISPGERKRKADFRRATGNPFEGRNPFGGSYSQSSGQRNNNTWSGSGNAQSNSQPKILSRHKCAICGRTEISNPELEFRFCSKCNGNYEYCSEHLFSHTHVE